VQTPIWDKGSLDEFKETKYMASMVKFFSVFVANGKKGMPLAECSQRIADIFENPKPKVRYALVKGPFMNWTLPRLMPARSVDKFFLKNLM
jgi:hypothetical protein